MNGNNDKIIDVEKSILPITPVIPSVIWGCHFEIDVKKTKNAPKNQEIYFEEEDTDDFGENDYYLYDPITKYSSLFLIDWLRWKSKPLMKLKDPDERKPLCLYINSYGGDLLQGFSVVDEIRKCIDNGIKIDTVIDGPCASAATIISIAGSARYMKKHGFMLIHQLSSIMMGTYENFKDNQENIEMFMKKIILLYQKYTKFPENELEEILKHDLWLDSDKCLEYGLVDKLY